MAKLKGMSFAGSSPTRERVENDYYATPFETTKAILDREVLNGSILEPAAGEGHIAKVIREYYPDNELFSFDLVQRKDIFDIGIQSGVDFLTHNFGRKFDNVITNPPFKYAREFIEKALELANKKVIMFAKIQLLESEDRIELFREHPPKAVYVFSHRQNIWRNGNALDENGKPWSSVMCFAWFVWDKEAPFNEPVIRWIN